MMKTMSLRFSLPSTVIILLAASVSASAFQDGVAVELFERNVHLKNTLISHPDLVSFKNTGDMKLYATDLFHSSFEKELIRLKVKRTIAVDELFNSEQPIHERLRVTILDGNPGNGLLLKKTADLFRGAPLPFGGLGFTPASFDTLKMDRLYNAPTKKYRQLRLGSNGVGIMLSADKELPFNPDKLPPSEHTYQIYNGDIMSYLKKYTSKALHSFENKSTLQWKQTKRIPLRARFDVIMDAMGQFANSRQPAETMQAMLTMVKDEGVAYVTIPLTKLVFNEAEARLTNAPSKAREEYFKKQFGHNLKIVVSKTGSSVNEANPSDEKKEENEEKDEKKQSDVMKFQNASSIKYKEHILNLVKWLALIEGYETEIQVSHMEIKKLLETSEELKYLIDTSEETKELKKSNAETKNQKEHGGRAKGKVKVSVNPQYSKFITRYNLNTECPAHKSNSSTVLGDFFVHELSSSQRCYATTDPLGIVHYLLAPINKKLKKGLVAYSKYKNIGPALYLRFKRIRAFDARVLSLPKLDSYHVGVAPLRSVAVRNNYFSKNAAHWLTSRLWDLRSVR